MKFFVRILLFCIILSCQSKSLTNPYPVIGRVIDDENQSVAGSVIILPNKKISTTQSGTVRFNLTGTEGETVRIHVDCPDKWQAVPTDHQDIILQRLSAVNSNQIHPIGVSFLCIPTEKKHVVIVKTNASKPLPIEVMGDAIATTDDDGLAQFIIEGSTNEEIELRIDTSKFPNISPQMPTRLFRLPGKRRFFIFDQQFSVPKKPEKKKKLKRRRTTAGPKRL